MFNLPYTGIGARDTPENILKRMQEVAIWLAKKRLYFKIWRSRWG